MSPEERKAIEAQLKDMKENLLGDALNKVKSLGGNKEAEIKVSEIAHKAIELTEKLLKGEVAEEDFISHLERLYSQSEFIFSGLAANKEREQGNNGEGFLGSIN